MREPCRLSVLLVPWLVPVLSIAADGKCDPTCLQSLSEQQFNISLVAARRFFAIDEEQPVVATSAIFMRTVNAAHRPCMCHESSCIDEAHISKISSAIHPDPNEPVSNWPPYQGNFPLPASFGDAR